MSETTSPSYRARHKPRVIRTLDQRIADYLREAPARRGDIGRDIRRPACEIAAALARLERGGVIEQYLPYMQRTTHYRIRSIAR